MSRVALALAVLAVWPDPVAGQPGLSPGLSILVRGEPAQPGSVLAVTVTTPDDVERVP